MEVVARSKKVDGFSLLVEESRLRRGRVPLLILPEQGQ